MGIWIVGEIIGFVLGVIVVLLMFVVIGYVFIVVGEIVD